MIEIHETCFFSPLNMLHSLSLQFIPYQ